MMDNPTYRPYPQDRQHREHYDYVWPIVLQQLRQHLPPRASILDAGCGNGAFAKRLAEEKYRVCGFDISESGLAVARRCAPALRFELASGYEDLHSLFSTTFDAAVSIEVIEHLYTPGLFLRRIREVLKPGGTLILTTPYHGYLKNLVVAMADRFDEHVHPWVDGGHIKFFSRKTLSKALQDTGFEVVHFQGAGRIPGLWKSMIITGRCRNN